MDSIPCAPTELQKIGKGIQRMEENELRRYYRTLVTCHSELCWLFEEKIDETAIRKLVKHFRDEMQRVEEELDRIEQADKV